MEQGYLLIIARHLATVWHHGQFRRDGVTPYIEHPKTVASHSSLEDDLDAQAVAWLHDILEDTEATYHTLEDNGIPEHIIHAIVLLTKTKNENNVTYWNRLKQNPLARKVKIADMISNLSDKPTEYQIQKYAKGLHILTMRSDMDDTTTDLKLPNGGDGIHCQDRLVGRCLCSGTPNTNREGGKWEGYQGPIRPRPDDLIYRGGAGQYAEYQCPHCFGMWESSSPNTIK